MRRPRGTSYRGRRDVDVDRGAVRRGKVLPARGKVTAWFRCFSAARLKTEEERRRGKLTVTSSNLDEDGTPRGCLMHPLRRRQEKSTSSQTQETREKVMREVILPETITIQELSQRMSERRVDVIKF